MDKSAIVLLSGGLDSTTVLYDARQKGYKTFCLIFDYGQRHIKEIRQATAVAKYSNSPYSLVRVSLPWQGSALLDENIPLPENRRINSTEIPATYVPARNIIFLSFSVSYAEAIGARAVFIGANAIDYSGYPDCRPEFFKACQTAFEKGLKSGIQGRPIKIHTPLIRKTKAAIIRLGLKLGAPYHLTWSCYKGGRRPCGTCDSCLFRKKGFAKIGVKDPAER